MVPPALLAVAFLVLPLAGLLANVPWTDISAQLRTPDVRNALYLSLICPIGATLLSIALGVPLAWLLARGRFPGRGLVRGLVTLPMVLPPVVGGVALLYAFGRGGLVGRWGYREFGISLPYTTFGVMVASAFVSMPFLILTVEAGIVQTGVRFEEAAETLGAGRLMVLRRITLPMLSPSLMAGATLCWARALGELGATLTFAGNLSGTTQTTPLAVFIALQTKPQDAVVLSLVLFVVSLAVLLVLRGRRMVGHQ
ncbi:ABC transporter permease [Frankia gtarii]|nr:ABC transporter permease [Frankia gtarii]